MLVTQLSRFLILISQLCFSTIHLYDSCDVEPSPSYLDLDNIVVKNEAEELLVSVGGLYLYSVTLYRNPTQEGITPYLRPSLCMISVASQPQHTPQLAPAPVVCWHQQCSLQFSSLFTLQSSRISSPSSPLSVVSLSLILTERDVRRQVWPDDKITSTLTG